MMPSRSCSGVNVAVRAGLKAIRAGFSNGERLPTSRPVGPCTLVVSWDCDDAERKGGADDTSGAGDERRDGERCVRTSRKASQSVA